MNLRDHRFLILGLALIAAAFLVIACPAHGESMKDRAMSRDPGNYLRVVSARQTARTVFVAGAAADVATSFAGIANGGHEALFGGSKAAPYAVAGVALAQWLLIEKMRREDGNDVRSNKWLWISGCVHAAAAAWNGIGLSRRR